MEFPEKSLFYYAGKRSFDIVGGFVGLVISFLPIAILVILIKRDGGPAFFVQERIGLNGKPFKMYKLRSMVVNADELKDKLLDRNEIHGGMFKMKEDPRVTKVGRIIRHYSLDELPQFLNVLKGEMSLIGPRPCLPRELAKYSEYDKNRLLAKPGISGLWQVSGRSNLEFKDMIELDLKYIRERSLIKDLKICLRTIWIVVSKNSGGLLTSG
ncbi:sugar transferase [Oenococcus alcoholitolerans]|uniref:sugar transferase n=1 Tax=Oenococcus alcoholitolerans TaxID=931074 RepID=UPI003F6FABB1